VKVRDGVMDSILNKLMGTSEALFEGVVGRVLEILITSSPKAYFCRKWRIFDDIKQHRRR